MNFLRLFMRRILSSALLLIVSASLCQAAESSAPSSGSQKSGSRSTEGARKSPSPTPGQGAGTPTGGASGGESSKRKTPAAKSAPAKAGTEDERFANARKTAAEDPKVVELREKADLAKTEEAGAKAMRAYLRALYTKMRTLEPSLEGRINLTEAAALKAVSKQE
jgi:hypothetical protein